MKSVKHPLLTLLTALCFLIVFQEIPAQYCGTTHDPEKSAFLNENSRERATYVPRTMRKVRIMVHEIRPNSQFQLHDADVTWLAGELNNYFAPANIEFEACGPVNRIVSPQFAYHNHENHFEPADLYEVANSLNIYVHSGLTYAGAYAYYPPFVPRIHVLTHLFFEPKVMAHEVGHIFSLFHTHGPGVEPTLDEYVNGTNCLFSGDHICDTPADPGFHRSWSVHQGNCSYTFTITDPLGDTYQADPGNIMAYSPGSCQYKFTPEQYSRVAYSLVNDRPELIVQDTPLADFQIISLETTPLYLIPNQTYDVSIDFRNQSCATVDGSPEIHLYLSEDNIADPSDRLLFAEKINGGSGISIRNFSKSSWMPADLTYGEWFLIAKIDATDQVDEVREENNLFVKRVTIYRTGQMEDSSLVLRPNPGTGEFWIDLHHSYKGFVQIELRDFQGRSIWSGERVKFSRQVHWHHKLNGLSPGLYSLKLTCGEKIYHRVWMVKE